MVEERVGSRSGMEICFGGGVPSASGGLDWGDVRKVFFRVTLRGRHQASDDHGCLPTI